MQRPARGYWLFGAWAEATGGAWPSDFPEARVMQITFGFGPWKIQFVKVTGAIGA